MLTTAFLLKKNVLPPNDDITIVKQVFAFRFLLAYKFDRDKWDQIVSQEMGISHLTKSLRHVKFEVAMKLFNPRRACAARVTVVVLRALVCLSVCPSVTTFSFSALN